MPSCGGQDQQVHNWCVACRQLRVEARAHAATGRHYGLVLVRCVLQAPQVAPRAEQQPPLPQLYHGQLYNALLKMALSPLHPDAALSCAVSRKCCEIESGVKALQTGFLPAFGVCPRFR